MKVLIPDSSFYSCLYLDTNNGHLMNNIIKNFHLIYPEKISLEIRKSISADEETSLQVNKSLDFDYDNINLDSILGPFVTRKQIEKGECVIIAIAYILNEQNVNNVFILDDKWARDFIKTHFSSLLVNMSGTIFFLKDCVKMHKIFDKNNIINVLNEIRASKFRCENSIIDNAIRDLST